MCPRSMDTLLKDMAVEISSRVATVTMDRMEHLGSLWATYSLMRRVCGDTVVGRRIPLRRVLLCGIKSGT